MRKDTTFSDRKLSREEFSKKYWLNGDAPYQYHTAEIEDGRDEREQFMINNVRAIWETILFHKPRFRDGYKKLLRSNKKATMLAATGMVAGLLALGVAVCAYLK